MQQETPRVTSVNDPLEQNVTVKILFVGDVGTGKTSLIYRQTRGFFLTSSHKISIGVDFSVSKIEFGSERTVTLCLWDIAGQDRFSSITRAYYRRTAGAFVVFDVTKPSTLASALRWKADLDEKVFHEDGSPIDVMLVANKHDLIPSGYPNFDGQLDQLCKEHNFVGWIHASARTGLNVDEMMHRMAMITSEKILAIERSRSDFIPGPQPRPHGGASCGCS